MMITILISAMQELLLEKLILLYTLQYMMILYWKTMKHFTSPFLILILVTVVANP